MVNIAIIDDGLTRLNNNILICGQYEYINKRILSIKRSDEIKSNHGSICAALIAERPTGFYSIKIIRNGRATSIESLKTAIEFASTLDVSIIHISLGSFHWIDGYSISVAVRNATSKGIVVVGSISVDGRRTFPGAFSNVIGVCSASIGSQEFVACDTNLYSINVFADIKKEYIDTNIGSILIPQKSSYAAALVTKKLCEWLENNSYPENDLEHFYQFIDKTYHGNNQNASKLSLQKKLLRSIDIFQSVKFSQVSDEAKVIATVKTVAEAIEIVNKHSTAVLYSRNMTTNSRLGVDDFIAEYDIKKIAKLYCSNQIIELR